MIIFIYFWGNFYKPFEDVAWGFFESWIRMCASFFICFIFWFDLWWTCNYNFFSSLHKLPGQGKVKCMLWLLIFFILVLDGHAFGVHNPQVNCKYSLPEVLFNTLWNSCLHILIYESDFLPSNNKNHRLYLSLSMGLHWISFCNFTMDKMLPSQKQIWF